MSDIKALTLRLQKFAEARDWKKFHNHKDMALSLVLEATEVLEHFQWKNPDEVNTHAVEKKDEIASELADVAIYLFQLSDNLGVDLADAVLKKIEKNELRYSVEKSKGNAKKYTEL